MDTISRGSTNNLAERRKKKNIPCSLLTNSENEKLFEMIGTNCMTMACAVVQLFLTDMKSNHLQWLKKYCGVICLIKDFNRRSYFLRSFDMDKCAAVWEQELYEQFEYKAPKCFFHTFEADNCVAGLNFADTEEAKKFKDVVCKTVKDRRDRKQEKRRSQQALKPTNAGIVVLQRDLTPAPSYKDLNQKEGRSGRRGLKKGKLTKEDIGMPTNFTVLQHVGFDPERGFEVTADDPELLSFLSLAGVSETDLSNKKTRKFIYDFIDKHGGIDAAKQEVLNHSPPPPPPPPVREAPPTPGTNRNLSTTRSAAPPPPPPPPSVPPVGSHQVSSGFGVRGAAAVVPPPPPSRAPAAPRSPAHGPSPGRGGGLQPPPPPPPPPSTNSVQPSPPPPPPPPVPRADFNQQSDPRSVMLEQIRKGKTLNPVVPCDNNNTAPVADNGRDALLNQIRRGIELKPVAAEDPRNSTSSRPMMGLAGALARALEERNRAVCNSDESESGDEEEDDDDEWED